MDVKPHENCSGGSRSSGKGGGGGEPGNPDPKIRGGGLKNFFFRPFGP